MLGKILISYNRGSDAMRVKVTHQLYSFYSFPRLKCPILMLCRYLEQANACSMFFQGNGKVMPISAITTARKCHR